MRDNVVFQWIISGLSVVAFIILFKMAVSYMPSSGPLGAIKAVVAGI